MQSTWTKTWEEWTQLPIISFSGVTCTFYVQAENQASSGKRNSIEKNNKSRTDNHKSLFPPRCWLDFKAASNMRLKSQTQIIEMVEVDLLVFEGAGDGDLPYFQSKSRESLTCRKGMSQQQTK